MYCARPSDIVARTWVSFMTSAQMMTQRGRMHVQQNERRKAMIALRSSLEEVERSESDTMNSLRSLATQVRQQQGKSKGPVRDLLVRSISQRSKLTMIGKKRMALQQHLETLEASELNQQVLNSVKQTSEVLKSMGLSQRLENVDELMLDMSESHDDMRSIQIGLGASHASDIEDEDLEKELEMLFADENVLFVSPPPSNSMAVAPQSNSMAVTPQSNSMAVTPQSNFMAVTPQSNSMAVTPPAPVDPPVLEQPAEELLLETAELAERPAVT